MKTLFLTVVTVLLTVTTFGQGQTAREQTILNVFGRLNLALDPYKNLHYWTDGDIFYRPFFFDVKKLDVKPLANGDTIFFYGGTLHEGGYEIKVLLAPDGKMTIADDDWQFKKGDRVEYHTVGDETILLFSDARGAVTNVLKKFDGDLYNRTINDFYRYIFAGSFKRMGGSSETIRFDRNKSSVSGLLSKGEASFTLIDDFGDTPSSVLCFSDDVVYKAIRTLIGMELIPIMTGPDIDLEWLIEKDPAKPVITLVKTAEEEWDLPPERFPLVSKQVMTLCELDLYAGEPKLQNLKIMRNEIFARYGYKFKTADMAGYFGAQDWYVPQFDDVTSKLTEIERINIALIQILEKK